MGYQLLTSDSLRSIIDENVPFQNLVKDSGIFEFYEHKLLSMGISYEELSKFDADAPQDVYIFNLFLDGEYINIEGEFVRDRDGNFADAAGVDPDAFESVSASWNRLVLQTVLQVQPGAFVDVLIADCCDGFARVLEVMDAGLKLEMVDGRYSMIYPDTELERNPLEVSFNEILEIDTVDLEKYKYGTFPCSLGGSNRLPLSEQIESAASRAAEPHSSVEPSKIIPYSGR